MTRTRKPAMGGGKTGRGPPQNRFMSDDIPFDKSFGFVPGIIREIAPGVRALCAGNANAFTFKGTVTYIVGRGQVAIVDPGPDDEAHVAALLDAVRHETVTHIFVTHTHRDHSPAAARVVAATGAKTYAEGPHRAARPLHIGELNPLDASGDAEFRPDIALEDGAVVGGKGWTLEAVATPGHTANHMVFALKEADILFSGDHVMGWSTSIVGAIRDAPQFVRHYIAHRKAREASILHRLGKGETDIPTLVRAIYIGLDPRLTGAAGLSVLAHLEDLVARGVVATQGAPSIAGRYRLAGG